MLRLSSESTIEPVTVDEIKNHLRIDATYIDEDELLEGYITAARKHAEDICQRAFVPSEYVLKLSSFANATASVELAMGPVSSSAGDVSVAYIKDDTAGSSTTLGATAYTVDYITEPNRIYPAYDREWPNDVRDFPNAITITYKSGYVATSCPGMVKNWIKMQVGSWWMQRERHGAVNLATVSHSLCDGLLDRWRVYGQR